MMTKCYIVCVLRLLHTAIIYLWILLGTMVLGTLAIMVSFVSKTGNAVHWVARQWARTILWVSGIRVSIEGAHLLGASGPCIFMANHASNFDIPVLLGSLQVQFRWLAKAELFKIPILGAGMRGAGYISIDRSHRASAFQSLARAAHLICSGRSVMIFPEGTRSQDGQMRAFKKGGFVLAVDAGVPIIPIVIKGTYAIMPKNRWIINCQAVSMQILAPIETTPYTRKTKDELMACVHKAMMAVTQDDRRGGNNA
jgi:1-acyl-sn-glycerol-3-phosphate acyltransferase